MMLIRLPAGGSGSDGAERFFNELSCIRFASARRTDALISNTQRHTWQNRPSPLGQVAHLGTSIRNLAKNPPIAWMEMPPFADSDPGGEIRGEGM
jgi:hypothetical protein